MMKIMMKNPKKRKGKEKEKKHRNPFTTHFSSLPLRREREEGKKRRYRNPFVFSSFLKFPRRKKINQTYFYTTPTYFICTEKKEEEERKTE